MTKQNRLLVFVRKCCEIALEDWMRNVAKVVKEVVSAVLPVGVFVVILQLSLALPAEMVLQFLIGMIFVTLGLILFFIGVETGLMQMGESIGAALPKTGKLWIMILFGFIVGVAATIAEPALQVLASQVDSVSAGSISRIMLVSVVAVGTGVFAALAMIRVVLGVPMKYVLMIGYSVVFILALLAPAEFLAISLDASGATTGPMTVPFILALGLGVISVLGTRHRTADSFGFVALASIGPIISVLLLGVFYG